MRRLILTIILSLSLLAHAEDSLPPLSGKHVPQNLDDLWGSYDPRKEPLETEITQEWEQDGIVCRVVRYRIGTFKGKPATMAAFYAFPKGAKGLPAILQIHGGGQSASLSSVTTFAKLGYVGLSLNWGGNRMSLANGKAYEGPNTDWGALDATHPPQRNKANHFAGGTQADEFTLDPIESPRNDNWFIVTIGSRRALTFLEQQPEVDASKIGVTGHSMGGRLTVMLAAIDSRVKTAIPSCGGSGDFDGDPNQFPATPTKRSALGLATESENPYIARLKVPTLWFSPTNDFHANIDTFAYTWRNVPDAILGLSISPHFNHRHVDENSLTTTLWFDQYLRGKFTLPHTPQIQIEPKTQNGSATFTVTPDRQQPVKEIRLYASTDPHTLTRFWRTIPVTQVNGQWRGVVDGLEADNPLFAFANVVYDAPEAYHKIPTSPGVGQSKTFVLSTRVLAFPRPSLSIHGNGLYPLPPRSTMIDDGAAGWRDWYQLNWGNPTLWSAFTRKIKDPIWRGPAGSKLEFEINPANDTIVYVTLNRNDWGAFGPGRGEYFASAPLKANGGWVKVSFNVSDFQPVDGKDAEPLKNWSTLTELCISGHASVVKNGVKTSLPSINWKDPNSIRIRNLQWVANPNAPKANEENVEVSIRKEMSEAERTKEFNDSIKKSLEQEALDSQRKPNPGK